MEYLSHLTAVIVALRWILIAAAFVVLGALYAVALSERSQLAEQVDDLVEENAHLRRDLIAANALRKTRRRQPIIAGRVVS